MRRCAIFGSYGGAGFPQAVRRALRKSGFVAALSEPVAKPRNGEGLSLISNEKGQLTDGAESSTC